MKNMEERDLLTTREVSELTGLHEGSIRRSIRNGLIPAHKVGRTWFISRSWITDGIPTSRDDDKADTFEENKPCKRKPGRPKKTRFNFCPDCGKNLENMPTDISFCPWCGKVMR